MVNTPTRVNTKMEYEGVAAEDLKDDSTVLKVNCPELLPQTTNGNIGAGITTGSVNLKNRDGVTINTPIVTANHIVATWGGSSNSRYPPMVRKGEPVVLYKHANQDKYFWKSTGRGRDFRTTDRVQIEVAATDPTKPGTEKTDENTYSVYMDSDRKKVGMKTSQSNGEVTAFSMEADLENGTFHLSDNTKEPNNRIFLDTGAKSGVPVIQLNLSSGAVLKMQGDDVFIKVPKKLFIDVGERFVINSPLTVFNLNTVGVVLINAANVSIKATKSFIVDAATIGLNGATKVGSVLVAASARINSLVKGSAGSNYTGVTIKRPEETSPVEPSNSPDTSMSGPPYTT